MDNATNRVLDRLAAQDKAAGGTGTDYKLAQLLGIERQQVSKYRTGRDQMGDGVAIRAAELLHVQALRMIGEIQAERARDERSKKFWTGISKGKVAAVILSAFLTGAPRPVSAGFPSPISPANGPGSGGGLCILC